MSSVLSCSSYIKQQTIFKFQNQHMSSKASQKILPKQKKNEAEKAPSSSNNGPQAVAEVFSISRDINVSNPYHIDGDVDMYTEQQLQIRQQLRSDEPINAQLDEITALYATNSEGDILEEEYKKIQKEIALILRPDIESDELKFIVDKDWELDSKQFEGKFISKQKLKDGLFQMVDIWTVGVDRDEYVSFCKLLRKKLLRVIKK